MPLRPADISLVRFSTHKFANAAGNECHLEHECYDFPYSYNATVAFQDLAIAAFQVRRAVEKPRPRPC